MVMYLHVAEFIQDDCLKDLKVVRGIGLERDYSPRTLSEEPCQMAVETAHVEYRTPRQGEVRQESLLR